MCTPPRTHVLRYSALFAVFGCLAVAAQDANRRELPSAADIVAMIGDDATAGGLIARAIGEQLQLRKPPGVVVVGAHQIPARWLPQFEGVSFNVMNEREFAAHVEGCGTTSFFQRGPRGWERSSRDGFVAAGASHCVCR